MRVIAFIIFLAITAVSQVQQPGTLHDDREVRFDHMPWN